MPCYLLQRIEVDLSKVDPTFVTTALMGLESAVFSGTSDYAVVTVRPGETVVYRDGKLQITARSSARTAEIENAVKRGISNAVVQAASKKFRWTLKATKKQNEYTVEKRGF